MALPPLVSKLADLGKSVRSWRLSHLYLLVAAVTYGNVRFSRSLCLYTSTITLQRFGHQSILDSIFLQSHTVKTLLQDFHIATQPYYKMEDKTAPMSVPLQSAASDQKPVDPAFVAASSKTMQQIFRAEVTIRNRKLKREAKSHATTRGESGTDERDAGDEDDGHEEAHDTAENVTDQPNEGFEISSSSINPGSSASNRVREHWPKKHGEHGFQLSWSVIDHANDKSVVSKLTTVIVSNSGT